MSDGHVQELGASLAGRTLNEDFRRCAQKLHLILTAEKPAENGGSVSGAAIFEPAMKGPVDWNSLNKAAEFEYVANHKSRILPTAELTK